ncbi:CBS domain-containing protein [Desulfoferrobacter suflitae]|uniref:CBS domain-containing protein n=1 Tax=Desulfoferrobacter suflitae TaxID=2865782 RepID=UPI002164A913|nr:CBS domain-containing protein [Desulfoferrobacter suflitae]MCK8600553.1 CBS domain-containing protein [Desulfoferrobacter suflitae]
MYVGWKMKTHLLTATPETSVFKAREMMDEHRISHLPVTDGKAGLLGIVTDRDLKEAWASSATTLSVYELTYVLQKLVIANVMTKNVITATPDMTIERAARIILDHKIGALPVLKNGKLVGIITTTDLMDVLLMALGLSDDTKRFSLLVRDRMGVLAQVGQLMQQADINIRSIMTVPLVGYKGIWQILLRTNAGVYEKAIETLQQGGFKVISEYVEDLTPFMPRD